MSVATVRLLFSVLLIGCVALPVLALAQDLQATPATSYDQQERESAEMPAEWFACKKRADCGLVSVPCMPSLAVRADKKELAQAAICKAHGDNCPASCDASILDVSKAECRKGECITLFQKKVSKPKPQAKP